MIKGEYKYSAMTEKIIGCAMKVHNTLGNGFQEMIYQRALAKELGKAGIDFAREVEMPIHYDGEEIGTRRADFLVDGKILVELKALTSLEDVHIAQGLAGPGTHARGRHWRRGDAVQRSVSRVADLLGRQRCFMGAARHALSGREDSAGVPVRNRRIPQRA